MTDTPTRARKNSPNKTASRRIAAVNHRTGGRKAPSAKALPADAFATARKILLKGRKLDMVALAARLGVGRATLYRWTGHREQLIQDVLATFLSDTFQWLDRLVIQRKLRGAERIATEIEEMMRMLMQSRAIRGLLKNEPDVALRILMSGGAGTLQAKSIERLLSIVEQESVNGNYRPRLEPHLLAYATVRLVDSYVYGSTIAGMKVDLEEASQVIRSLL